MAKSVVNVRPTVLLFALVLAAYLPAWPGGFLVEDWTFLKRHEEWTLGQTVAYELGRPLKDRAWVERERPDFFTAALWRPVPYILMDLEHNAFGNRPLGYFITRLTLHAITAWLFAVAVAGWTGKSNVAWIAGAFYGVHPTRLYPLFTMVQSQMLLAAFGVVLALWGLGVWRTARPRAGIAAVVLGAAVACWSYEQAVALLVLLPVLDLGRPTPGGTRPAVRDAARRAAPIASVVLVYLVLRVIRFEGFGGYTTVTDGEQLFDVRAPLSLVRGAITTTGSALLSLAAPLSTRDWNLTAPLGTPPARTALMLNGVIAFATLVLLLVRARSGGRAAVWGVVALVGCVAWCMLPVAGLLRGLDPWNRYLFFPGMAWVVVLAWALAPRRATPWARVPLVVGLGVALLVSWLGCRVWSAAWMQAHGLRAALDRDVPKATTLAYVYIEDVPEWVGGRNLFIRNLEGPVDVGRDASRLRLWPAAWDGPAPVPQRPYTRWPFDPAPQLRFGAWNRSTASLQWKPFPTFAAGGPHDRLVWDMRTAGGRAAWKAGSLLDPIPGGEPGVTLHVGSAFAALQGPPLAVHWTPAALGLEMRTALPKPGDDWVEILFYTATQRTASPTHLLRARTQADGQPHRYIISLLDHPVPAVRGPVTRIGLRPSRHDGARVHVRTIWVAAVNAEPPPGWNTD